MHQSQCASESSVTSNITLVFVWWLWIMFACKLASHEDYFMFCRLKWMASKERTKETRQGWWLIKIYNFI